MLFLKCILFLGFLFLVDCVIVNNISDLELELIGVEYVIFGVIVFDFGIYKCIVVNIVNLVIKEVVVNVIVGVWVSEW